mgnify:CR=1 FL=1
MKPNFASQLPLNLAIVGGGRTCRYVLELIRSEAFPYLNLRVIGVCDINSEAEGFRLAREMGIYTTNDFCDLFSLDNLDGIIELTNSRDVLLDLIQLRPARVGILEHNIGRVVRKLFAVDQKLRSAEQQVLLEKAISDFLIQQVRQRIVVLNTDFTIAEANEAYLKAVNRPRSEVIGSYCYQIIHGFDSPCSSLRNGLECPMLETLRTGKSAQVIHPDPAVGISPAYSDIVTCPVTDANGKIVRVIEIWRDITREISTRWEKRERELRSDLNKIVQEDRLISLGKLVASCVHEINNPIQGLLTFSHLMQDILVAENLGPQETAELRKFATLMGNELERCGNIITGLLSFSRESRMTYRSVDLNDVLSAVIALTRHKMELQNIDLTVELDPNILCVHGDTNRLQQCFLNLIFNAIEAMPSGGQLAIRSAGDPDRKAACIRIGDTGPGIPEDDLGHIFDPFFSTKEMGEGTGLGLSIVYGVMKNHGGEVRVDSNVGSGTEFILRFPLEPV